MAFLSWSDQYLVGNETIDSEHRELFLRIEAFHEQWTRQRRAPETFAALNEVLIYIQMHFRHEEAIMRKAGYPDLEEHCALHRLMVDILRDLQASYESKELRLEEDTMRFLKNWLIEHILERDVLLRPYLPSP